MTAKPRTCALSIGAAVIHTEAEKSGRLTGWWTESIADGGGHHGTLHTGTVHAVCGRRFEPLPNGITKKLTPLPSPADKAHACLDCVRGLRQKPRSR